MSFIWQEPSLVNEIYKKLGCYILWSYIVRNGSIQNIFNESRVIENAKVCLCADFHTSVFNLQFIGNEGDMLKRHFSSRICKYYLSLLFYNLHIRKYIVSSLWYKLELIMNFNKFIIFLISLFYFNQKYKIKTKILIYQITRDDLKFRKSNVRCKKAHFIFNIKYIIIKKKIISFFELLYVIMIIL